MKFRLPKISIRRWELKKAFILFFVLFTFIPFVIISIVSYAETMASYRSFLVNSALQITETMNVKVDEMFEDAISLLSIGKDPPTQAFLAANGPEQLYEAAKEMGVQFENMRRVKHYDQNIYDISVISVSGSCISERNGFYLLPREFSDYETVRIALKDLHELHISSTADIQPKSPMETNIMSVTSAVFRSGTNDVIGIVKVDLLKDEIHSILESSQWSSATLTDIVNDEGISIFHDSFDGFSRKSINRILSEGSETGHFAEKISGSTYQIFYNTLDSVPWKLVIGISEQDLRVLYFRSDFAYLVIMPLVLLVIMAFIILILNRYIQPVTRLRRLMEQAAEGDLSVDAHYEGNFEISELYESFQSMVSKIDLLMKAQVKDAVNYKTIELQLLQAQINPHFLYNTLDSVIRVAEAGQNDKVIDLIMALSQYYKAALSHGSDTVPIATVVKHITSYLSIMKMRFSDILDYAIEADEPVLEATLPKLAIQPLVENAILHGIKNKRGGGKVSVSFRCVDDGMISVTVHDDGVGMTPDRLQQLNESIRETYTNPSESFGLKNINQRIKILFGEKYGIEISSEYLQGTTVTIAVPFVRYVEGGLYV